MSSSSSLRVAGTALPQTAAGFSAADRGDQTWKPQTKEVPPILPAEAKKRENDAAEQDSQSKQDQNQSDEKQQPSRDEVLRAVLKGAALGSAAGAAVGAWAAFARVMWPD